MASPLHLGPRSFPLFLVMCKAGKYLTTHLAGNRSHAWTRAQAEHQFRSRHKQVDDVSWGTAPIVILIGDAVPGTESGKPLPGGQEKLFLCCCWQLGSSSFAAQLRAGLPSLLSVTPFVAATFADECGAGYGRHCGSGHRFESF
eukprot:2316739-Rhodomonas_salina.2